MIKHWQGFIKQGQKKSKEMCDVVVVIALYNQGQFLQEALESVYQNTWEPVEVVVVDDCSTDDSSTVAAGLCLKYGARLINNSRNMGLAGARNAGIGASKSSWIVCLDADDKLELNYFEEMAKWQKASNADVLYTDAMLFMDALGTEQHGKTSRALFPNFAKLILRVRNICLASSMFSREVYIKCGGFDERFKHGLEDYALWLKACQMGFKFAKCETTGLYYRRHAKSMSGKNVFAENQKENYKLLKEIFGDFYLGRGING